MKHRGQVRVSGALTPHTACRGPASLSFPLPGGPIRRSVEHWFSAASLQTTAPAAIVAIPLACSAKDLHQPGAAALAVLGRRFGLGRLLGRELRASRSPTKLKSPSDRRRVGHTAPRRLALLRHVGEHVRAPARLVNGWPQPAQVTLTGIALGASLPASAPVVASGSSSLSPASVLPAYGRSGANSAPARKR
jgi:hypothetical protein